MTIKKLFIAIRLMLANRKVKRNVKMSWEIRRVNKPLDKCFTTAKAAFTLHTYKNDKQNINEWGKFVILYILCHWYL